jgi:hypothetical protein
MSACKQHNKFSVTTKGSEFFDHMRRPRAFEGESFSINLYTENIQSTNQASGKEKLLEHRHKVSSVYPHYNYLE